MLACAIPTRAIRIIGVPADDPEAVVLGATRYAVVLVTSSDQPDDLANGVVKAVFQNLADFRRLRPALSALEVKDMVPSETVLPIHPGALNYYREAGLVH